jgi:hypothetical protein
MLNSRAAAAEGEGGEGLLVVGEGGCSINSDNNGADKTSGRGNERQWWGRVQDEGDYSRGGNDGASG